MLQLLLLRRRRHRWVVELPPLSPHRWLFQWVLVKRPPALPPASNAKPMLVQTEQPARR